MAELAPARGRPAASEAGLITGRIVDAAWEVLLETGPEQFSLDRVASMAHASKQTIYARFSGKLELLQAVLAARTGLIFAEFVDASTSVPIETVIAEVTRRSVNLLSAPEASMLDRLVDWVDLAETGGHSAPVRVAIYSEMRGLLSHYLEQAVARSQLKIADINGAASFWLDGLIGHVRGVPSGGAELEQWAQIFARMFLRAVSDTGHARLP
jgi:TetR/AcrR family transcriptional regulator, mexJK operon transcriptional repressor